LDQPSVKSPPHNGLWQSPRDNQNLAEIGPDPHGLGHINVRVADCPALTVTDTQYTGQGGERMDTTNRGGRQTDNITGCEALSPRVAGVGNDFNKFLVWGRRHAVPHRSPAACSEVLMGLCRQVIAPERLRWITLGAL